MPDSNDQSSTRYESLIFKDRDLFTELEAKAKKIFMLDSKGCVIFQVPRELLTIRQLVMVYLLAQVIGYEHKLKDTLTIKGDELGKLTGTPTYAFSAITNLHDHCFVEIEDDDDEETAETPTEASEQPDPNNETQSEAPQNELQSPQPTPQPSGLHNLLRSLHLVKSEPEEVEKKEKPKESKKVYRVSLTMVNIVLDEILVTVAIWERKNFYPFKWQDQQRNVPYLPQN